jgi:hypothetical protein
MELLALPSKVKNLSPVLKPGIPSYLPPTVLSQGEGSAISLPANSRAAVYFKRVMLMMSPYHQWAVKPTNS